MGADIQINHSYAQIRGVVSLHGADVTAMDLRGGAALVGAAIKAKAITVIDNCDFIERGYEKLEYKLKQLGVDITKER